MERATLPHCNWRPSLGGFPFHFLCFMIFFFCFSKTILQGSILYCSACSLRKINIFWGICSHWENVSLMNIAILTSLPAWIKGNLTNRALDVQEASLVSRGAGVGTTGGIPSHFPKGWSRGRRESGKQAHQWEVLEGGLALGPNSRVSLSVSSEGRLGNRFRIPPRLWDHPREACTIKLSTAAFSLKGIPKELSQSALPLLAWQRIFWF